eukprot:2461018-Pyramimonas_sp.AAC.1
MDPPIADFAYWEAPCTYHRGGGAARCGCDSALIGPLCRLRRRPRPVLLLRAVHAPHPHQGEGV